MSAANHTRRFTRGGTRPNVPRNVLLAMLLLMPPLTAVAQPPLPEWFEEAMQRRALGIVDVDLYVKVLDSPGPQLALPAEAAGLCAGKVCQGVDVEKGTLPDGSTGAVAERPLPPEEMSVRAGLTNSEFLDAFGNGLIYAQVQVNELLASGGLGELSSFGADELVLAPLSLLALGGGMAKQAAAAVRRAEQSVANSKDLAQTELDQQIEIYRAAKFLRQETFGGTTAAVYRNDSPPAPPPVKGQDFQPKDVTVWVDPERYRFLKQRIEGEASANGESRDFYIEVEYSDFRNPPGCGQMDEPFKRTMRMGGILDKAEMAKMEEARKKLAEFEQQLAAMPAQQRAMMERMMGSQMQMMRNIVKSGAIEYVEQTEQILCNPDLTALFRVGPQPQPGGDQNLVKQIQEYLVILGYEPGNVDGVLDTLTQVAISQFQAEEGLPVTGQPSAELAARLAERVGA
jgi:hypothetical protein